MNQFIEYRREFHKYPENGWREIRTSARVAEILTAMGYTCLMGPDVVNVDSIIPLVRPSEAEIRACKERAVAQGANPEFVTAFIVFAANVLFRAHNNYCSVFAICVSIFKI